MTRHAQQLGKTLLSDVLVRRWAVTLWLLVLVTCSPSDALRPSAPGRLAVVAGLQSNRLLAVDLNSGTIKTLVPGVFTDGIIAGDPEGRLVFARSRTVQGARGVLAIEPATSKTLWTAGGLGHEIDFSLSETLVASTAGDALLVCNVVRATKPGAVLLEPSTGRVLRFLDGLPCTSASAMPPSGSLPSGGFALFGRRDQSRRSIDSLFLLSAQTFEIVDSLAAPASPLWGAVAAPDGRSLYLAAGTRLFKYDLALKRIAASVPSPIPLGLLTVGSRAGHLLLSDPGVSIDLPGLGFIYEYDGGLALVRAIDLRSFSEANGTPPTMGPAQLTTDGALVVVATGTPERGSLYGVQRSRLLVVNYQDGAPVRAINLKDWGAGLVLPLK